MATRLQAVVELLADAGRSGAFDYSSHIAPLSGGGFVVTWGGAFDGVRARIFDSAGVALGDEFAVGPLWGVDGFAVTALASGGFAITWLERPDSSPAQLKAQIYDPAGAQVGGPITVSADAVFAAPAIAGLDSGGFIVAVPGQSGTIVAYRYDSAGNPVGAGFEVAAALGASEPDVVATPGGGFVVAWHSYPPEGGQEDVHLRRFDAAGTALGDTAAVAIGLVPQAQADLTVLASGAVVVSWSEFGADGADVYYRLLGADGTLGAASIAHDPAGDQRKPSVAALPDGGFIIAWDDRTGQGLDTSGVAIRAQRFDAVGNRVGDPFDLNGYKYGDQSNVDLVTLADGTLAAVYRDAGTESPGPNPGARVDLFHLATVVETAGGAGGENFAGTAAPDDMSGNGGDDVLSGAAGDDRLSGGDGDDTIAGGDGEDRIEGGAGADHLEGGRGDDLLLGGEGDDVLVYSADGSAAGFDRLEGGGGNDTLIAYLRDFQQGDNVATLLGGDGDDLFQVDWGFNFRPASSTLVIEGGAGTDTIESSISFTLPADVERLVLTGNHFIDGTGRSGDDVLIGNQAPNTLSGLAGNDILQGGDGNDTLNGGQGNDRLDGGAGADSMDGGEGDDVYVIDDPSDSVSEQLSQSGGFDTVESSIGYTLPYGVERLVLTGGAAIDGTGSGGNDVLVGNDAANTLLGQGGNDTLDGAGGADVLKGGDGNDVYLVGSTDDQVVELAGQGIDEVRTSLGSKTDYAQLYVLPDNVENLTGTSASAQGVRGNGLDNVVTMGGGNDLIVLDDGGNDRANGGGGNDFIYYGAAWTTADKTDGGAGTDTVGLMGSYSFTFAADSLVGVERLALYTGQPGAGGTANSYAITMVDANVAPGLQFFVTAASLAASESLVFNGSAESDGSFTLLSGAGADILVGGA
ncbi:MAG: hypothetical protein JOZ90_03640, partial [Alphaproteobacteria bacterium]|nr:hypothetical protein [Alphaproteobacteria bacterium]MBV9370618.1 hypothetical protein [Alphaproteobacteria bacterium]MBV9900172.1 hypothetical protein [Alphaproteobacteria bacterium]